MSSTLGTGVIWSVMEGEFKCCFVSTVGAGLRGMEVNGHMISTEWSRVKVFIEILMVDGVGSTIMILDS